MAPFKYQNWKKRESEQRILNGLSTGDRSFGELLDLTHLSKPILSMRLKSLEKERRVKVVPDTKTKRFLYHLEYGKLSDPEKARVLLHSLSVLVIAYLEESAEASISDKEYAHRLMEGFTALQNFRMFEILILPRSEQEEYLRAALGPEFAERIPKLFPEGRNVFGHILESMAPKEQAIYRTESVKDAASQLLKYLNTTIKEPIRYQPAEESKT